MSERKVPKRINRNNWQQFANLDSKHTTKGMLLEHSGGIELMYALTSTHVFVYWANHGNVYLVDYAELASLPDLWDYIGGVSVRMLESLANDAHRSAMNKKASKNQ